ncbi:hypothetical protein [Abyssogena phaseoliformis symbiont]|uniref:hypothetical protein n=1 Tax=Abyssogena phaseoliformis symbiont TaxID=596095 RepID=UPI001CEDBC59|nr:hypothetical protein [Abyssogena phaseoliformis symbiont]MBW5289452.1 hypothetical protein [Candidatus Ruthia sp. Apha_13_S6]
MLQGSTGKVVFKASDYVTNTEMSTLWLPKIATQSAHLTNKNNLHGVTAQQVGQ